MAKVRLKEGGPRSVNKAGFIFNADKMHHEVPAHIAKDSFEGDQRFAVTYAEGEKAEAPPAAAGAEEQAKGPPTDKGQRLAAIRDVIDDLDVDDEENWNSDGKPDARVLTSKLGWQVTSAERDEAMAVAAKARGNIHVTRKQESGQELIDAGEQAAKDAGKEDEGGAEEDDPTKTGAQTV